MGFGFGSWFPCPVLSVSPWRAGRAVSHTRPHGYTFRLACVLCLFYFYLFYLSGFLVAPDFVGCLAQALMELYKSADPHEFPSCYGWLFLPQVQTRINYMLY